MKDERNQADDTLESRAVADDVTADHEVLSTRRKAMFDLLKHGGYDWVEVEYEGHRGVYTAEVMTFYKGAEALTDEQVPKAVSDAVWGYVAECIPMEEHLSLECVGTARIRCPFGPAVPGELLARAATFGAQAAEPGELLQLGNPRVRHERGPEAEDFEVRHLSY